MKGKAHLAEDPFEAPEHRGVEKRTVRRHVERERRPATDLDEQLLEAAERERLAAAERDLQRPGAGQAFEHVRGTGDGPRARALRIARAVRAAPVAGVRDPEHDDARSLLAEVSRRVVLDPEMKTRARLEEERGAVEGMGAERGRRHRPSVRRDQRSGRRVAPRIRCRSSWENATSEKVVPFGAATAGGSVNVVLPVTRFRLRTMPT